MSISIQLKYYLIGTERRGNCDHQQTLPIDFQYSLWLLFRPRKKPPRSLLPSAHSPVVSLLFPVSTWQCERQRQITTMATVDLLPVPTPSPSGLGVLMFLQLLVLWAELSRPVSIIFSHLWKLISICSFSMPLYSFPTTLRPHVCCEEGYARGPRLLKISHRLQQ